VPRSYSAGIWQVLSCPKCQITLENEPGGAQCTSCQTLYQYAATGALDLRLREKKVVQLEFQLGMNPVSDTSANYERLKPNPKPEVDFSMVQRPHNISKELLSYFPKARDANSLMLDLGCGTPLYKDVAQLAGYEYVGIDLFSPDAPLLGDAQALPFKSNSFDLIWTNAVLQYIPYPFVTIREIYRVLKPNGVFIGTVGFLEPFDGDSFYMYTRLGVLNWLVYGNLKVEKIAPDDWWTGLVALSSMGLFPNMPAKLSRWLTVPLDSLSKLWWRLATLKKGGLTESNRLAHTTGGFQFMALKA